MDILTAILAVFAAVGEWFSTTISTLIPIFFANGSLTFLGVLSVAGLAFSVVFLLIGVIQNFLHFRG